MTGITTWSWNGNFALSSMVLTTLVTAAAGFGEEILFRGYLLQTLSHYGTRTAALVSSIIFAMVHMLTGRVDPLDQLALFLHGYMFAVMTQRTKSIWPGLVIHFVYNGLTCLVWMGSAESSLLLFDGSLGWTKWAFKALMVVPFLLAARLLRTSEKA